MGLVNLEDLIAVHDGENLLCMECADLEQLRGRVVKLYTEEDRDDDIIMVCDLHQKII